tara:strand:+ start:224 stop:613 length:390 start_codon:yes stop_codon:yes gene_type:complete
MKEGFKKAIYKFFIMLITITLSLNLNIKPVSAIEKYDAKLIEKISKDYTKKFCNSIAFGLSKESAMNFSIAENKQVFKNKKGVNEINKEILAEQIAISTVENCGYIINLKGQKGIEEFKSYYLDKEKVL